MDLIADGLATGRMVRTLGVVDAYTRECLGDGSGLQPCLGWVARVLERVLGESGRPKAVRAENGLEFTSRRLLAWPETGRSG